MRNLNRVRLSVIIKDALLMVLFIIAFQATAGAHDINAEKNLDSLKNQLSGKTGKNRVDLLIEISQANWAFGFEESLDYATRAYQLAGELNYREGLSDALNRIGNVHYFLENYSTAVENYNKAIDIANSLDDSKRKGMFLNNMGLLFGRLNEYDSSEIYLMKALKAKEEHGDKELIVSTLNNIGILYRDQHRYVQALEYFERQLRVRTELDDLRNVAVNHRQIGEILYHIERYTESLLHLKKSLDYAIEAGDEQLTALTHYHIARNKLATGDMDLAMKNIDQSLEIASNFSYRQLLRDNYKLLYQHNKLSGNFESALKYLKMHTSLKDSLRIQNSDNQYKQLQGIFETEKQNLKIDLLQKDNRVQELLIIRHNHIKFFLVVLMSALVIFMALIAYRIGSVYRTSRLLKQKINELETTNKKLLESSQVLEQLNATKNRFFSIIAHDLKNPFNALLGFSEMISTSFNELEEHEIRDYISIVRTSSLNLHKLLENLLKWSASQTKTMNYLPEKFNLAILIHAEINLIRLSASKKQIEIMTDLSDELIIVSDKLLISSVIRNLLDNAVKFTHQGGKIKISAKKENQHIYAAIEDTGIGIPDHLKEKLFLLDDSTCRKGTDKEEGGGLGLILCKELIEKSKGEIGVESREGIGSRFWFKLPLENKNISYG
jgi:signal transduction histidine kinase